MSAPDHTTTVAELEHLLVEFEGLVDRVWICCLPGDDVERYRNIASRVRTALIAARVRTDLLTVPRADPPPP